MKNNTRVREAWLLGHLWWLQKVFANSCGAGGSADEM